MSMRLVSPRDEEKKRTSSQQRRPWPRATGWSHTAGRLLSHGRVQKAGEYLMAAALQPDTYSPPILCGETRESEVESTVIGLEDWVAGHRISSRVTRNLWSLS